MFFVNPWAIVIGAVAALAPVLIHWLTRPRPVVRPLSTLRFVQQAVAQRRARRRLRDFVILAARTAAVLLLAAAVARPKIGERPESLAETPGLTTRVVLFDVSQSMAARTSGIQVIERARPVAAMHLAFRPGLDANLLLAGATTQPAFDRPSSNFAALRDELGKAAPRPERLNVQAAFTAAAQMLANAGGRARRSELVILSDFQRTQWATADFSVFPRATAIHLEFAGTAEAPPNLAVLRVGGSGRAEVGRPFKIEVDVGNFSPAARQVEVELSLADASYRQNGLCAAGTKTTLSIEFVPRTAGWQTGRAGLVGMNDALAEDDTGAFVIDFRPPPVFALVTRQAAGTRPSSSYYLERALEPAEHRDDRPAPRIVRFDPDQADRDALAATDLILLDHPGRLPEALMAPLAGWLRRGRAVFYVASEPADAENLERLADLAGTDLRLPVQFASPPQGAARGSRFIADFRRDAAPFQVFGDTVTETLAPLRFSGGLVSRRLADALADDVRASYSDRTACLVVSTCGAGTLAILNADLGASNLPTSSAFVPLIGELTTLLLGRQSVEAPVACGEPFALPLPADAGPVSGLSIVSGGDARSNGDAPELIEEREGIVCRSRAATAPGDIRIKRGERTVFALATVVPEQESDLKTLPPSVFQDRLAGDRAVAYRDASRAEDDADGPWAWLAVACVTCLALELILLRAFRT
ncbi:MAG: BatA domain-containing protein [Isosphaerales bacterium]